MASLHMKTVHLFVFYFFLSYIPTHLPAQTKTKASAIVWSDNKLTWDDFQDDNSYNKYPSILAKTHTKLYADEIDTTGHLQKKGIHVNVYALMIPSASWVRESSKNKTSVLAHEQLHFDIVEVVARRLRKKLSETKVTIKNYKKVITSINKEHFRMLSKLQAAYDKTHLTKWKHWVDTIHHELNELRSFRPTTVFMQLE